MVTKKIKLVRSDLFRYETCITPKTFSEVKSVETKNNRVHKHMSFLRISRWRPTREIMCNDTMLLVNTFLSCFSNFFDATYYWMRGGYPTRFCSNRTCILNRILLNSVGRYCCLLWYGLFMCLVKQFLNVPLFFDSSLPLISALNRTIAWMSGLLKHEVIL